MNGGGAFNRLVDGSRSVTGVPLSHSLGAPRTGLDLGLGFLVGDLAGFIFFLEGDEAGDFWGEEGMIPGSGRVGGMRGNEVVVSFRAFGLSGGEWRRDVVWSGESKSPSQQFPKELQNK